MMEQNEIKLPNLNPVLSGTVTTQPANQQVNQPVGQLPGFSFMNKLGTDELTSDNYPKLTPKVTKEGGIVKHVELPICAICEVEYALNSKPNKGKDKRDFFEDLTVGRLRITFEGIKGHQEEVASRFNLILKAIDPTLMSKDGKTPIGQNWIDRDLATIQHIATVLGVPQEELQVVNNTAQQAAAKETEAPKQVVAFFNTMYEEYAKLLSANLFTKVEGVDAKGNANNRKYVRLHIKVNNSGKYPVFEVNAGAYNGRAWANFLELYKPGVKPALVFDPKEIYEITATAKPTIPNINNAGMNNTGMNNNGFTLPNLPDLSNI